MFSAASQFRDKNWKMWNELQLEGNLSEVVHYSPFNKLVPHAGPAWTNKVPCPHQDDGKCPRCNDGRGGYTFRWLSPMWVEAYRRQQSLYSWKPEEGVPDEIQEFDPISNVMDCRGIIIDVVKVGGGVSQN
jgi:hypothetical protein